MDSSEYLPTCMLLYRACACLFVILTLTWFVLRREKKNSLPGPMSFPLVGSLLQIGFQPHKAFQRMRHKYGDVFEVTVGAQKMVILSGYDTIKEAMVTQSSVFSDRPYMFTSQFLSSGESLSFSTATPEWRRHRRLAEHALKLLAEKSDFLNKVVNTEAEIFAKNMVEACKVANCSVDPSQDLLWSVAHIKYSMCFGDSRKDKENEFRQIINGVLEAVNSCSTLNFFPLVRHLATWKTRRYINVCDNVCSIANDRQDDHMKSFQPGIIRDALDALIQVGKNAKHTISDHRLLHTSQDFMGAGLDIMFAALSWCILYLAAFPEIQKTIRAEVKVELSKTGGRNRKIQKHDMKNMPFTQAFIYEVLRHSSTVPFSLPHSNTRETYINGVRIPPNSFILASIYSINMAEAIWGDATKFRPERFLNATGALDAVALEKFTPCGLGRRKCVGEALAKQELFLYVTSILNYCDVIKPDEVTEYDLEPEFDLCLKPKPYRVIFKKF